MEKRAFKRRKKILAILVVFLIVISMTITVVNAPAHVISQVTVVSSQSSWGHGLPQTDSPSVVNTPTGGSSGVTGGSMGVTSGSSGITGGLSGKAGGLSDGNELSDGTAEQIYRTTGQVYGTAESH